MPQACSSSTPPPIRLIVDCLKEREKKKGEEIKISSAKSRTHLWWEQG